MGKKAQTSTKKTHKLSHTKKKTITLNKDVKRGKALMPGAKWERPTSRAYKKKMQIMERNKDRLQETEKEKQSRLDEDADEAYDELVENMDQEDLQYIRQMAGKSNKRSYDDEGSDLEEGALKRIHAQIEEEKNGQENVQFMLPIKTKAGWKDRSVKVEGKPAEESEPEEDENEGTVDLKRKLLIVISPRT